MSDVYISRFENKNQPDTYADTKIVEAFGLGKCPKLVQQIAGSDLDVRINALAVLCEEFRNPYSIEGCAREGAIKVLGKMIKDPDFTTRVRATNNLALAAMDANGLSSIIEDEAVVIPQIISGIEDPSEIVREHVYNCLLYLTRSKAGVERTVAHGVTAAFVNVLWNEIDALKPVILRALHNTAGSEQGLAEAINLNATRLCIDLLSKSATNARDSPTNYSDFEDEIIAESARTLGFICFDGRAKKQALDNGAIEHLIALLKVKKLTTQAKASISIALMAITSTNDGKIQAGAVEGVEVVIALLYDDNKVVVLNTLKIISNLAIYPRNREILNNDSTCIVKLRKLAKADDKFVSKHATIALNAVNWTP